MDAADREATRPLLCKAILLCERVEVDRATGRWNLLGTLDKLLVPRFPTHFEDLKGFVYLIDGEGHYQMTVEIQDLTTGDVIADDAVGALAFESRAARTPYTFTLPAFRIDGPGTFDFVVFANGQEIDRLQFAVCLHP